MCVNLNALISNSGSQRSPRAQLPTGFAVPPRQRSHLGFLLDDTHGEIVLLLDHDIPDRDTAVVTTPPSAQREWMDPSFYSGQPMAVQAMILHRHAERPGASNRNLCRAREFTHRAVVDGDSRRVKLGVQQLCSFSQRHYVASRR